MPIYEYECPKCQKVHEIMQKFSDPVIEKCPECEGPVSKIMSMTSFALKGSGWYTTDYKKSGKKVSESDGAKSSSSITESSASSKNDSSGSVEKSPKKSD